MGGTASFKPTFNITLFPFFLVTLTTTLTLIAHFIAAKADHDSRETPPIPSLEDDNGAPPTAAAAASSPSLDKRNSGHFKPSAAAVFGLLTIMFALTFLLLLYFKQCNGGDAYTNAAVRNSASRTNSGIKRAIMEQLPLFRFRSLRGQKEGLDCAVCLTRFEDPDVLRLLPKCKHAFHVDCIDKWLEQHSSCPLCRYKVDPKDIVTWQNKEKESEEEEEKEKEKEEGIEEEPFDIESGTRHVPGRHSSVIGENEGGSLEIVLQNDSNDKHKTMKASSSRSRSFDITSITAGGAGFVCPTKKEAKLLKKEKNNDNNRGNHNNLQQHRLQHRIIIDLSPSSPSVNSECNGGDGGSHQESDLLFLTPKKLIRDASVARRKGRRNSVQAAPSQWNAAGGRRMVHSHDGNENCGGGGVLRSVSEIAGLRRFLSTAGRSRNGGGREGQHGGREERERRHREGVFSRWSAWISRLRKPRGDVR